MSHRPSADAESTQRKARSESILGGKGIPINPHLPPIASAARTTLRAPEEVARRLTVLAVVAAKSETDAWDLPAEEILRDRGLWDDVTPAERAYLAMEEEPDEEARAQFTWRYEAAWVFLWALGYLEDDDLGDPTEICDVPRLSQIVVETPPDQFIGGARLRPIDRILDQADLAYRYNWAAVDARINNRAMPGGIHPGITYERQYAFNWLTRAMDQDWDDVQTHTCWADERGAGRGTEKAPPTQGRSKEERVTRDS